MWRGPGWNSVFMCGGWLDFGVWILKNRGLLGLGVGHHWLLKYAFPEAIIKHARNHIADQNWPSIIRNTECMWMLNFDCWGIVACLVRGRVIIDNRSSLCIVSLWSNDKNLMDSETLPHCSSKTASSKTWPRCVCSQVWPSILIYGVGATLNLAQSWIAKYQDAKRTMSVISVCEVNPSERQSLPAFLLCPLMAVNRS